MEGGQVSKDAWTQLVRDYYSSKWTQCGRMAEALYAEGVELVEIATRLNACGFRTSKGLRWSQIGVYGMLRARRDERRRMH